MMPNLSILLPNIRSAYNVGSFFRTCDGLGVDHIYLCGYTAAPPHKEIAKTALGAENMVDWSHHNDAVQIITELQQKGVQIIGLEIADDSMGIEKFIPQFPLCLVVGNEVDGIDPQILKYADTKVHIPMKGKKESFNVMIAGSIALWELSKKRYYMGEV
jgi:tRNA G18 (ribose-2'-O)-methylase SpoU